ncbi:gametocyte-specific factor 1-like isoform X1 [Bradysia coprophila]|uniref:gametocyte-specific factor 1-like isoform X1 n=1 Tax=Bradysia coprophila TaxID=38358 RepID=UPI00187DB6E2|nr:gametocyte-specific factor 1-like isoform X1 [Bradysia coprophila]
MNKKPGYENTVVCPYNKCHVVLKSRFQIHLSKCAKQYPFLEVVTCPYDLMHKFRAEEITAHVENCPSYEHFISKKTAEEQQQELAQQQQLAHQQQLGPRITYYDKDCA